MSAKEPHRQGKGAEGRRWQCLKAVLVWTSSKETACKAGDLFDLLFNRRSPWRRKWKPIQILLSKIPWTKEPSGVHPITQRVRHDWVTTFSFFYYKIIAKEDFKYSFSPWCFILIKYNNYLNYFFKASCKDLYGSLCFYAQIGQSNTCLTLILSNT